MIPKYLSAMWTAIAPALGNHLWQSTLFFGAAGLLTLILRKNQARVRYWLWLAASVKFLIPFSLLADIGSHLAWSRSLAQTRSGSYFAMEELGQPFTRSTMPVISGAATSTAFASLVHALPILIAAVWLCGFVVVLLVWYLRWRRIFAAVREATPLREGREVEKLRQLERTGGMRKQIEILLSRASLEPGIFGIVRPVLIWPEGISERLEDVHLEAILAHELWHVRRLDNLAAAIHMVVEALFWFYPLVWWLGARLVRERERACDEEVLELGTERQVYAESILKICEFCVGSPLACVSGVTGADLKRRIVRIMSERVARKLDLPRKLLLGAASLLAVAVPVVLGLLNAPQMRAGGQEQDATTTTPSYEVISLKRSQISTDETGMPMTSLLFKPDSFTGTNITLRALIRDAYGVEASQISGAPDWLNSDKYDVEAKVDSSGADALRKLSPDQRKIERQRMLQALLAEHFKLTLHRETKELPVYELVTAENSPKLQEAKPGETYPNGIKDPRGRATANLIKMGPGEITGQGVPIATLARELTRQLGRNVLDKTGLTGIYDFTLKWTPDPSQPFIGINGPAPDNAASSESSQSSAILPAIQQQLGLKLEPQSAPMEILVIDHVEQLADN